MTVGGNKETLLSLYSLYLSLFNRVPHLHYMTLLLLVG